jgi:hypothetical protein
VALGILRAARAGLCVAVIVASCTAKAADTFIPKFLVGDRDTYLQLYGQIDPGLLIADDGQDTLGYVPVDNGNSSTRLGLRFYMGVYGGAFVGANVEAAYDPYSTNFVNRLNRGNPDWDRYLLRKAEGYFNSKQTGVLWLGQGSTASDGTAEVDLSGTEVIGYASIGELAGGQLFAFTMPAAFRTSMSATFSMTSMATDGSFGPAMTRPPSPASLFRVLMEPRLFRNRPGSMSGMLRCAMRASLPGSGSRVRSPTRTRALPTAMTGRFRSFPSYGDQRYGGRRV